MTSSLESPIYTTEIPENGQHKVVQVFANNQPILLIGEIHRRHGDILADFLKSHGMSYEPEPNVLYSMPRLFGLDYVVVGMGFLLRHARGIAFNGRSSDYRLGINAEHINACRQRSLFPRELTVKAYN